MRERPNPDDREPLAPPYCSDPNCAYCKELREIAEELRRKYQVEVQGGAKAQLRPTKNILKAGVLLNTQPLDAS